MIEIDVRTDVETAGPIPAPHSIHNVASEVYQPDKTLVATLAKNAPMT